MRHTGWLIGVTVVLVLVCGCTPTTSPESESSSTGIEEVVELAPESVPQEKPADLSGSATLPPHTVASDTDISLPGEERRRIEIHVTDPLISREDCECLIEAYRDRAGTNGQISVWKPDAAGALQPWAVDNMDGAGVTFNDSLFAEAPGTTDEEPDAPSQEDDSLAQMHYDDSDTYFTLDIMTAWTRAELEVEFGRDGGRAVDELWPMGVDIPWVEIKYVFSDESWLYVSYAEDVENPGGPEQTWRIVDIFPPGEAR